MLPVPPTGQTGELLKGRYRVGAILGEGAMGVVYRGVDEQLGTKVAIKTLQPAAFHSPKAHERFQREAGLANKLHHPGIAQILDFGTEAETPYLVMELVEGVELAEVIEKESPLPPARALDITIQLCEALAEAHRHNLIHRDIKPANIRLMDYVPGGPCRLKVLDFGIAKEIGNEHGQLTTTGAIMGTPLYLAPELLSEVHTELDGRIDQYSVGVVLYQLLAGCPPFAGQTVASILLSHVTTPPPDLPTTVPEPLQKVVLRMLKKTAKERFPNDDVLLRALKDCIPACRSAQTARRGATRPSSAHLLISLPVQTPNRLRVILGVVIGVLFVGLLAVLSQTRKKPLSPSQTTPVQRAISGPPLDPVRPVVETGQTPSVPAFPISKIQSPPSALKDAPDNKPRFKTKTGFRPAKPAKKEDPFDVPLAR